MKFGTFQPLASLICAAVVSAGLLSAPAVAQEDKFAESHIAAAREVVLATKVLQSFDDILPLLAEQTRTAFIQSEPTRAEEIIEVTGEVALKMAAQRSELNNKVYVIWARRFSEEELKELAAFYKTPLGEKLTKNGPTITALSIGSAREWQDKISTEMVAMVREELDKRNSAQ